MSDNDELKRLEDMDDRDIRDAYRRANGEIKGFRLWPADKKLALLRQLVAEHSSRLIDDVVLDVQSANAIVQVYGALKPENQEKFINMPLVQMAATAWKCLV